MFLLAVDVLIDGVGCGDAKDESSQCNHDNTKDHQSMPAVKEKDGGNERHWWLLSSPNSEQINDTQWCIITEYSVILHWFSFQQ